VFDGVEVNVGVKDKAAMVCLAARVCATDVRVALMSLVGDGV
jgi:hypothetical protein